VSERAAPLFRKKSWHPAGGQHSEKNRRHGLDILGAPVAIRTCETRGGIVSYQVVQEFFNVALRRFAKPMSSADVGQYLSATFRPLLSVRSSPALYGEALRIGARFRLAWYDSLIVASAIEGQCDVLYSEDCQDGQQIESVTISNPFV
jgi:predicted nucleic acid-binding protein